MEILILQAMILISVVGLAMFLLKNTKFISYVSKILFGSEELNKQSRDLK